MNQTSSKKHMKPDGRQMVVSAKGTRTEPGLSVCVAPVLSSRPSVSFLLQAWGSPVSADVDGL